MDMEDTYTHSDKKYNVSQDIMFSPYRKGRSTLEKCLAVLALILFVTTIIFLALFIYYYIKYDHAGESTGQANTGNICKTPDCLRAAAMMANKMNESVNPCEDFHEYACGRYNKVTVLPQGSIQTGSLYAINDENLLVMKDILTEEITAQNPIYLQNMKRLYRSCINEAEIDANGLQSYKNEVDFVNDWPTLNPRWDNSSFNISEVLARYAAVDIFPLFQPAVQADFLNSSKKSLFLGPTDFDLSKGYYSRPMNDSVLTAYRTYLTGFMVELGADNVTADQDTLELMSLLGALSKLLPYAEDLQSLQKIYNPMTLKNLSTLYADIDIPRILRATFATANMTLTDDDVVINITPAYFGNLSLVLANFSSRAIQNFVGYKYATSRVENLTNRLRKLRLQFDMVYTGQATTTPRWQICINKVSSFFSKGMAKQFVERTFPETAKIYSEEMVDNLQSAFKQILLETTWMGQETKDRALKKLAAMRRKVGYPDVNFSDDDINKIYKNFVMIENNYYGNQILYVKLTGLTTKESLRQPVDKTEWLSAPQELNAKYSLTGNEILLHAAILQLPVFSVHSQDSMNYGAIGAIIGHEITHGFDYSGSQFDENGNLAVWWQKKDYDVFLQRIQCLEHQYSGFRLNEINMNVNGLLTRNENVADNGGLKESYRAFKELVKREGERPNLPGLGLTQDQEFFLAYGQMWCEKVTPEGFVIMLKTNSHSPGKYRIIGALQNSEDFAKAFNCPRGSYMNPKNKCSVW